MWKSGEHFWELALILHLINTVCLCYELLACGSLDISASSIHLQYGGQDYICTPHYVAFHEMELRHV